MTQTRTHMFRALARQAVTSGLLLLGLVALWAVNPTQAGAADLPKLILFGMELQDTSHEGEIDGIREDQQKRLKLLDTEAEALFKATGHYQLVDVSSAAKEIEEGRPLRRCNGCDIDIAKKFNADYVILGVVYKVSNLILEIHLYLRDAKTGAVLNHMHTNIRGNTDQSWLRGLRWLIKNRLKAPA